jgi:hypothetical protein
MPVCASGVMLAETSVPSEVFSGLPPANGSPPLRVWHPAHSPASVR